MFASCSSEVKENAQHRRWRLLLLRSLNGNFNIVTEDNMILTYDPLYNTFELEIFAGSSCDNNTLTFVKK
jgi:hypothetical protein